MRVGFWIAIGALLLQGCRCPCPPGVSAPPPYAHPLIGETAGVPWVIFDVAVGPRFDHVAESYWQAEVPMVRKALDGIDAYLRAQLEIELPEEEGDTDDWHDMIRGVREKLRMYRCQVMGVAQDGRRLLYLNFFHRLSFEPHPDDEAGEGDDWTREPHFVDDGGDWYWQIYYDPASGTFERLSVNGEA